LATTLKKLWKNEYIQTAAIITLIVLIFFGLWFGATAVLTTPNPVVVVPTGSMCIPYDGACNGWDHPFESTLHVGDMLILQGIDPKNLNTNYPYSDIIVFHRPDQPSELIVHRIMTSEEVNGTLYFRTKGDGNPITKWPNVPQPEEYDPWAKPGTSGVSQDLVVGKVVLRIPWVGHLVLFMQTRNGIIAVAILVALLLIIEFIIPIVRKKPATKLPEPQKEIAPSLSS
jgi:signal peptidase I